MSDHKNSKLEPEQMSLSQRLRMSRRDFMRIAAMYGMTSTAIAATSMAGIITAPALAKAANSTYEKRFKTPAKKTLKFGGGDRTPRTLLLHRLGHLNFICDLEERTDGAIRIEYMGASTICNELNAYPKMQQGVIDIIGVGTQNCAAAAPYYGAIDFGYLFPSRAAFYYFIMDPRSEKLYREPLRRMHNTHFLFSPMEGRGIALSMKYKDAPLVTSIDQLKGAKVRSTGSQLGIITMTCLGLNPVPVAWEETYDALKQGLVDGQEVASNGIPMANMCGVTSQYIQADMFPATMHTAMNWKVFSGLEASLQDAIMESAYFTQAYISAANEATLVNSTGTTMPPSADTEFAKYNVRVSILTPEERKHCEELASPMTNPKPWESWRERYTKWAGCDVYSEIYKIAREIPEDTRADTVEPRRWWRG